MPWKYPKRPRDLSALAAEICRESTGLAPKQRPVLVEPTTLQSAAAKGGRKGGIARMKALTAKERSAIARKAALVRWGKSKSKRR